MINIDYIELIKGIWTYAIKPLWRLWILAFAVPVIISIIISIVESYISKWLDKRWLKKHRRLIDWKTMNHKKFERIVAIIFGDLGYKARAVGGPKDGGIDIIAHKDKKRFFIQCKRKNQIPPREIREFAGAIQNLNKEKGEKGFFVTTGEFTEEGKSFAKNNPVEIELINGFYLEKLVMKIEKRD